MKKFPGIDYDFRPEDYWLDKDVLHALVRNVKGAHRRKIIKAYYEAGNYQELDETFSKTTLSEEERLASCPSSSSSLPRFIVYVVYAVWPIKF